MHTVILYKRPSTSVGFFQPDSPTWADINLTNYYQQIKDDGILIADVIEISEDNLVMKKTLTWKDLATWQAYVQDFITRFPNYSTERHNYHISTGSSYTVNTYELPTVLITTVGNLQATIELAVVNNVAQATYELN
jgi:hypothetical protein